MGDRCSTFLERVANFACRLFILWLLYYICLSSPLVFGALCGSDCISARSLLFTFPHNLIKENLTGLIESCFQRERSPHLPCNDRNAFFTSDDQNRFKIWSCQTVYDELSYLLDNIFNRFTTILDRQIVEIPTSTRFAPLVTDLFSYKRDFMISASDDTQADIN